MQAARKPAPQCQDGHHRARPARIGETDVIRSTCLDCNCTLIRTRATRRWYVSGLMA